MPIVAPDVAVNLPRAEVILHIARALRNTGSSITFELAEICSYDLPTTLASTFETAGADMPMTTSSTLGRGCRIEHDVEQRDQLSPPSREKRFWPMNFVIRNVRTPRGRSAREMRASRRVGSTCTPSTCFLSRPSRGLLDVHVLDAVVRAVRPFAQQTEDFAQLHRRLAAETTGRELAVEAQIVKAQWFGVELLVRLGSLSRAGRSSR